MKIPYRSFIATTLGLALFIGALVTLHHELAGVRISDIQLAFHSVALNTIGYACALTIISYLILSLYDLLSLRFLRHQIPYRFILKASFLGYALSHSLGFAVITGGAARFGVYSRCGLSSVEIIQATAFNALIFWISVTTILCGLALCVPQQLAPYTLLTPFQIRIIGGCALAAICTALLIFRLVKVKINEWEISLPSLRLITAGIAIGILDWAVASYAAYSLLPEIHVHFAVFFGVFITAQILGVVSHVPGGLGVVEATIVAAFGSKSSASALLGSLLLFRIVYYLIPLTIALGILVYDELCKRKQHILFVAGFVRRGTSAILPQLLSLLTLISGALLLLSGAKPPPQVAYYWITKIVPLPLIELSHFAGSIVGIGLIILARGIRRRLDTAYYLVSLGLGIAAITTLIRGGHVGESIALVSVLLLLIANRESFYRKGSLLAGEFEPKWIFVVGVTLVATVWILFFAFKHVEYSRDLWWEFSLEGHAPRSLRGLIGAAVVFATWGWIRLLAPSELEAPLPDKNELEKAAAIVSTSPRTSSFLALLGDKHLLFNDKQSAFVMYAVQGNSCIAMGDPVGPTDTLPEMLVEYADLCDLHGYDMAIYQVHHANLPAYLDMGLYMVKLGEEAIVDLSTFSLEGSHRSWLRRNRANLTKLGYAFKVIDASTAATRMEEFATISTEWMSEKDTSEKGFSLGSFNVEYLRHFPFAVIEYEGAAVAFANMWCGAQKEELSIDLMRYGQSAPRGVMDFMFTELLLWGRENGYKTFNLGMAPLSGLELHQLAPLWNRVGSFVFRHGEHFYNFQGLRAYKEKFDPLWEPRYLATSGVIKLPLVLTNISAVISGGIRGIFTK